jgi:hypothetical protein
MANFLNAVRSQLLHAEIEVDVLSASLGHLADIRYRTARRPHLLKFGP